MKKFDFVSLRQITQVCRKSWATLLVAALSLISLDLSAQSYCTVDHVNQNGSPGNRNPCATGVTLHIYAFAVQQDGTPLYAANYGCRTQGYLLNSTTPAFSLQGGATYTAVITGGTGNSSQHVGIWIDLNADGDFTDAGEYCPIADIAQNGQPQERQFTVPCTGITPGATRMRVRSEFGSNPNITAGNSCGNLYYGSTDDYTISLLPPSNNPVGFSAPDTVFVGATAKLINNNPTGYYSHSWDVGDDGVYDYNSLNLDLQLNSPGSVFVRLRSKSCSNKDSVFKKIVVVNPTVPPTPDFIAGSTVVPEMTPFNLTDLSTGGATSWFWEAFMATDSANTIMTSTDQNPFFFSNVSGIFTVCLTSGNGAGVSDRYCRGNYIQVKPSCEFSMGPVKFSGDCMTGKLYDNGGPSGNYNASGSGFFNEFTINPCGASKVTLNFSQFVLNAGVNLRIWDGLTPLGTPLHTGSGFNSANLPNGNIVANSGSMYILFDGTSSPAAGFTATWTATAGSGSTPIASFSKTQDTTYTNKTTKVINTTVADGTLAYVWSIDGNPVAYTKDLNYAFGAPGKYEIKLEVTSCLGVGTFTDSIVVDVPNGPTDVDFTASNRRPAIALENVTFTSEVSSADKFKWAFSPNNVTYRNGTDASSENPVVTFNAQGAYSVTLTAWNSYDSAGTVSTVTKSYYVVIVNWCSPGVDVLNADIAISRVKLSAGTSTLFNKTSDVGVTRYNDFRSSVSANLTFGQTYDLLIERPTNGNNMSRRVWIDYNVDGDFDDAGELVASENPAKTLSFSAQFKVPDLVNAFEGKTVMRVATSFESYPNTSCGSNIVGEYEDYTINLKRDNTVPVITRTGGDTVYIEIGQSYADLGATAQDASEGDITNRIIKASDVDTSYAGIYTVTYNATDASGNKAAPVTRKVVVVVDKTAPVITLNGSDTIRLEVYHKYVELNATANDNREGNMTSQIKISGTVDTTVLGVNYVTYSVRDAFGNISEKVRTVIVSDTTKPVIAGLGSNQVSVNLPFTDETTVTDNYWTNVTLQVTGSVDPTVIGLYTVIYKAIDGSGNVADSVVRIYDVNDFTAPTIHLNTADTVTWAVNLPYVSTEASATDNYYAADDIDVSSNSTQVDVYHLGVYPDRITAEDPHGNSITIIRYVQIIDTVKPKLGGKKMFVRVGSNYNVYDSLVVTDNYYAPSVLKPLVEVLFDNVDPMTVGTYEVVFQVTDPSGNTSEVFHRPVLVYYTTGTNTVKKDAMQVYPNPSTGTFYVKFNEQPSKDARIEVLNVTGQKVFETSGEDLQSGSFSVNLSDAPNGVYFVRLVSGSTVSTQKLTIQH